MRALTTIGTPEASTAAQTARIFSAWNDASIRCAPPTSVLSSMFTPTAPSVAFELNSKTSDPLAMYLNDSCTVPMSLAGIPAISIPNGLSEGLPVGLQIAGPAFSENRIFDASLPLEKAIGFDGSKAYA